MMIRRFASLKARLPVTGPVLLGPGRGSQSLHVAGALNILRIRVLLTYFDVRYIRGCP
jgi:hypothetical protein